jgi:hypothetical protein
LVLRTGWENNDVAVAMSACNSPMGHMQDDNGTVLIGTAGEWLIADPGYQQYLAKKEREYTLGVRAHNAPVINGKAQAKKNSKRLALETHGKISHAALDLTACYTDVPVKSVIRHVWQKEKLIVIADRVKAEPLASLGYNWHGHPEAGWWVAENWARVYTPNATVWFTSPQAEITESKVDRLSGSRGQLTLSVEADVAAEVIWWVFAIGDGPPQIKCDGARLSVGTDEFAV